MKITAPIIFFFVGLCCISSPALSQTAEPAIIHIFTTKPDRVTLSGRLIMNGNYIANYSTTELLTYTMYSEGNVLIEFFNDVPTFFGSSGLVLKSMLEVKSGGVYYMHIYRYQGKFFFESTTEEDAVKFANKLSNFKQVIRLEEDARNPIATISKEKLESGPKSGTGFLLSEQGYIVTNYHVVNNANNIVVKGVNGDFYAMQPAEIVASDKNTDLAIIKLKNPNVTYTQPPFYLQTEVANTGESVFLLGYPLTGSMGEEVKLTTGVVSSKTGYQGDIGSYQVSAPAQPGNSGGPLLDKKGNLIGVVNAKIMDAENVTYVVKTAYLKTLIELAGLDVTFLSANELSGLELSEQVKQVSPYVYIIEVNK